MDIRLTVKEDLDAQRTCTKEVLEFKRTQKCPKNLDEPESESLETRGRAKFRPLEMKKRTTSRSQEPEEGKGENLGDSEKGRCRSLENKERKKGDRVRRSLQSVMSVIFMIAVKAKVNQVSFK